VDAAQHFSHCGPVAAANSLWWFESSPIQPPVPNDNYYLVTSYLPGMDDHFFTNVGGMGPPGLVDDLACYFGTNVGSNGTEVHKMATGLQQYLYNDPLNPCFAAHHSKGGSYYDNYHVQLVKMPTWNWVVNEVERSEDVILLLGFWQLGPPSGWVRVGGHYVTVAGINSTDTQIAFSDPFFDNAEGGAPGRVLTGTLMGHSPVPGHAPVIHNDAGNVSHDIYGINLAAATPFASNWEIMGYPYFPPVFSFNFQGQNCPDELTQFQGTWEPIGGPIFVEVEYAIAMSPFDWKAGGEWVDIPFQGQWLTEWWRYTDDADSCLPDFTWGAGEAWYDGPTALANSLWWFDSKAETLVTGGSPVPPPGISDHYSLVRSYGLWDDHAITNTVPLIQHLAGYLNSSPSGTTPASMVSGIDDYLAESDVGIDYYTKTQNAPNFQWIADEVRTSEDVLMLLGFYEDMGGGIWERKGGHWVNAAGVSWDSDPVGMIGLSDPTLDNAIGPSISGTLHLGRVFPPEHWGSSFTNKEKLSPQGISHDIYSVATGGSLPGGAHLGLTDYPVAAVVDHFIGINGDGSAWGGGSLSTVVEWAIGVSPYSDLVITKTAVVTPTVPKGTVTYTLQYANNGLAAALNLTIQDILPDRLTEIDYTAVPPLSAAPGITYSWTLPLLSFGQGGTITITAKSLAPLAPYNIATITGTSTIGHASPDRNLANNINSAGRLLIYLPVVLR